LPFSFTVGDDGQKLTGCVGRRSWLAACTAMRRWSEMPPILVARCF